MTFSGTRLLQTLLSLSGKLQRQVSWITLLRINLDGSDCLVTRVSSRPSLILLLDLPLPIMSSLSWYIACSCLLHPNAYDYVQNFLLGATLPPTGHFVTIAVGVISPTARMHLLVPIYINSLADFF